MGLKVQTFQLVLGSSAEHQPLDALLIHTTKGTFITHSHHLGNFQQFQELHTRTVPRPSQSHSKSQSSQSKATAWYEVLRLTLRTQHS